MKKIFFFLLLLSSQTYAADGAGSYYIPPTQFNAALEVLDGGFANVFALFRNATGSFAYDDATKSISNLKLAIDTTSLLASNNDTQRDLANLLDAFKYTEIRITAPDAVAFADNKADIKATVTLHGTSKPVTFEAILNRVGTTTQTNSMWSSEGQAVGMSLHGTIKRADFGMVDDPAAPSRYGDTITLMLEVQAIKQ